MVRGEVAPEGRRVCALILYVHKFFLQTSFTMTILWRTVWSTRAERLEMSVVLPVAPMSVASAMSHTEK